MTKISDVMKNGESLEKIKEELGIIEGIDKSRVEEISNDIYLAKIKKLEHINDL
jgi:hypothetical protein